MSGRATAARVPPALIALVAFGAGAAFAIGLMLAGMTQPSRVIGFLDIGGAWDPTLAFVMGGAVLVHLAGTGLVMRRPAPLFDAAFHLPMRSDLDRRLLAGAAVFGVGWGLAGYCPGPALVALGDGGTTALVFVATCSVGMVLHRLVENAAARVASVNR